MKKTTRWPSKQHQTGLLNSRQLLRIGCSKTLHHTNYMCGDEPGQKETSPTLRGENEIQEKPSGPSRHKTQRPRLIRNRPKENEHLIHPMVNTLTRSKHSREPLQGNKRMFWSKKVPWKELYQSPHGTKPRENVTQKTMSEEMIRMLEQQPKRPHSQRCMPRSKEDP